MNLVTQLATAQHQHQHQHRKPELPIQGQCTFVGHLGHIKGLYLNCQLDRQPYPTLVDTGSTISLVRPGILSGTTGPLSGAWSPVNTQLGSVPGEKAGMRGLKPPRSFCGNVSVYDARTACVMHVDARVLDPV